MAQTRWFPSWGAGTAGGLFGEGRWSPGNEDNSWISTGAPLIRRHGLFHLLVGSPRLHQRTKLCKNESEKLSRGRSCCDGVSVVIYAMVICNKSEGTLYCFLWILLKNELIKTRYVFTVKCCSKHMFFVREEACFRIKLPLRLLCVCVCSDNILKENIRSLEMSRFQGSSSMRANLGNWCPHLVSLRPSCVIEAMLCVWIKSARFKIGILQQ